MKRTSPSSRLVSKAARSPDLAMTGPDVARKPTPISRATIWASVVLPSPGGPWNSTWSRASPRAFAAETKAREAKASDNAARNRALDERLAAGKALREKIPRNDHGRWKRKEGRPDPIQLLRAGKLPESRASLDRLLQAMVVTSPYQASLEEVKWTEAAIPGRPVLTFVPKSFIAQHGVRD